MKFYSQPCPDSWKPGERPLGCFRPLGWWQFVLQQRQVDTQFPPTSLQFRWFLLSVLVCERDFGVPAGVSMTPKTWAFLPTGREPRGRGPAPLRCTDPPSSRAAHRPPVYGTCGHRHTFAHSSIPKPSLLSQVPFWMTPEWLWIFTGCRKKTDSDLALKWHGSKGPSRLLGIRGERGGQGAGRRESKKLLSAAASPLFWSFHSSDKETQRNISISFPTIPVMTISCDKCFP